MPEVFKPGDKTNDLLRKILANGSTSGGGGGGGGGTVDQGAAGAAPWLITGAVTGPLTDTQLRASAVPISAAALPLPSGASTEATLATLNGKVTACNTGAVVLAAGAAAIGSVSVTGSVTVTGPLTDTQLRATAVPISAAALPLPSGASTEATLSSLNGKVTACNTGAVVVSSSALPTGAATETTLSSLNGKVTACNTGAVTISAALPAGTNAIGQVGGKMAVIKDTSVVTAASAYSAGNAVGAKRTFANALTAVGTGVLESITLLDRANQSAAMTVIIFDADPSAATITDKSAFVYSTDDLKVLGQINISASDYTTLNSKAVATIRGIGLSLKSAGTSIYVALVTSGTPTFAATTDVQLILGILQD